MKLTKKQIPAEIIALFPDYTGRKFRASVTRRVGFSDLHWGGGTRNEYRFLRLNDGGQLEVPAGSAPWMSAAEGRMVELPAGFVCVQRSFWCGQDMGLTIHVHPDNVAKLLQEGK